MAGTRLYIQGLALIELIVLTLWSFYHGLCRNGDVLCTPGFWQTSDPPQFQLPPLEPPLGLLPLVQVDRQLHPDTGMEWKKNPNTVIVCSQPESPVVQGQIFWWCPPIQPQDPPRVVVRQSSMLVFSKETKLPELAMPEVTLPFLLTVRVVLEQSDNLADKAQSLALSLEDEIARLQDWPCVEAVDVQMTVIEPYTEKWIVRDDSPSEDTGESGPPYLPRMTEAQADELLGQLDLPSSDGQDLILYIPALAPKEKSVFQVGAKGTSMLLAGGLDVSSVHQWLSNQIGIPMEGLDADGSFPTWYEEWYWHLAIQELFKEVNQTFLRTGHLLEGPLELEASSSLKEHYDALVKLHKELESILTQKSIHTDFPVEHYAAIFAPLLFPLLLPFLAGLIKELKRYKEKKRNKSEQEQKKAKAD
jgi:hypothetical protein